MEEEYQKVLVKLEDSEEVEVKLLSVVEIDHKEYAICALDHDDDTFDAFAYYVIQDSEGYDQLVDIDDPIDKEKIVNYIKSILFAGKNNGYQRYPLSFSLKSDTYFS